MGFIRSLLYGLCTAGILVGGIVGWLRYGHQPVAATLNETPAKDHDLKVPAARLLYSQGSVDIVPLLEKLGNGSHSTLQIDVWHTEHGTSSERVGRASFPNPHFPYFYKVIWSTNATDRFFRKELLENISIVATFCPDKGTEACNFTVRPRLVGNSELRPDALTTAARDTDVTVAVESGITLINRTVSSDNLDACVKSGLSISGQIIPSATFHIEGKTPKHFALIGVPPLIFGTSTTFLGIEPRKFSHAEMETAADQGIAISDFNLSGPQGAPYLIKIPKATVFAQRNFYAVACAAGEDTLSCAARMFPLPPGSAMAYPELGVTKLVPKNFVSPMCGDKIDMYLHDWIKDAPTATKDAYRRAQPPELVEGMNF